MTVREVFEELEAASAAYKFSSVGGRTFIAVDGFMDSLRRRQ